jgi:Ulp1 family protease
VNNENLNEKNMAQFMQLRKQTIAEVDVQRVKSLLSTKDADSDLLTVLNNAEIRLCHFKSLKEKQWLNDEIINGYMFMLHQQQPKYYYFNSLIWEAFCEETSSARTQAVQNIAEVCGRSTTTKIFTPVFHKGEK